MREEIEKESESALGGHCHDAVPDGDIETKHLKASKDIRDSGSPIPSLISKVIGNRGRNRNRDTLAAQ